MKTGLFFGSFNPIHTGHLIIANYILENTTVEEVWFVLSPQNPFKKKDTLLDYKHRLKMVRLATAGNKAFKVSDIESQLPQPSYTINTLDKLKEKYPEREFSIIVGSDNMLSFNKWKNYRQILDNYKIYVYNRGVKKITLRNRNIINLNSPVLEISSTEIRQLIKMKKSVRYLVAEPVYKYLVAKKIYVR